jgi:hypothetical protein
MFGLVIVALTKVLISSIVTNTLLDIYGEIKKTSRQSVKEEIRTSPLDGPDFPVMDKQKSGLVDSLCM